MQTEVVSINELFKGQLTPGLQLLVKMRETSLNEWLKTPELADRLSGTLKKNARIGFKYYNQLEHEALCQVLGYGFESIPTTYITFNDAITEGDCHSLTEVGWHFDRLLSINIFPEDFFELKYINIQDIHGNIERQGVGIIVRSTSIQWVRKGQMVFSLLTEYDANKKVWTDCINPF